MLAQLFSDAGVDMITFHPWLDPYIQWNLSLGGAQN